jgi:hypothetical protein
MDVPKLALEEDRKAAFEAIKLAVIKGTDTLTPQLVPPGTSECGAGITEGLVEDLPSGEYFLKTLHRQHYANEDEDGTPPWLIERKRSEGGTSKKKIKKEPQEPANPQQQVRNENPASQLK